MLSHIEVAKNTACLCMCQATWLRELPTLLFIQKMRRVCLCLCEDRIEGCLLANPSWLHVHLDFQSELLRQAKWGTWRMDHPGKCKVMPSIKPLVILDNAWALVQECAVLLQSVVFFKGRLKKSLWQILAVRGWCSQLQQLMIPLPKFQAW